MCLLYVLFFRSAIIVRTMYYSLVKFIIKNNTLETDGFFFSFNSLKKNDPKITFFFFFIVLRQNTVITFIKSVNFTYHIRFSLIRREFSCDLRREGIIGVCEFAWKL